MNGNKLIAHTLIKTNNGYLVTKRSKDETTFPEYWDIPGDWLNMENCLDKQ